MKRRILSLFLVILPLVSVIAFLSPTTVFQASMERRSPETGTGFTYQGYLSVDGEPADGQYDLLFELFDTEQSGSQVGSPLAENDVSVVDGLFTVLLDFGDVFDGTDLWLQIGVSPDIGSAPYTTLTPRQAITAAPYASYASRAHWSGLIDIPGDLADGDDDTLGGLGCDEGQIAKRGESAWVCSEDLNAGSIYTAGIGLDLSGSTFSIVPTFRLPQTCENGEIIEWTGAGWACSTEGLYLRPGLFPGHGVHLADKKKTGAPWEY